jgi:hypothetical protein
MKTFTQLKNLFGSLSQNASATNLTLGGQLINDQHRYLLQKYFDNERTATTTTVGGMSLTLTGTLAIGAKTATLTAVWAYPTCQQIVNFSGSQSRLCQFTYNSATITWSDGLLAIATTSISTVGVQAYQIPANISKIKDNTISVGQLKFVCQEVMTRSEWDRINFLPYASDIPAYYFIYDSKLNIFPIPATTGNILTFNYKTRVADLTYADATGGHLDTAGMVAGSTAVTGTGTAWITTDTFPSGTDITFQNLCLRADPPFGDGIWYPIRQFISGTSLTLVNPVVNAPNITNQTTYTIGQIPILSEDFHDMLVFGALKIYFTSIVNDPNKFKEYDNLYAERLIALKDYAGTKAVNVDLGEEPNNINPNLFLYAS